MDDLIKRLQIDPFRKIHGHAKLELFDAKTHDLVQKVEHDNMVTNALQILTNNVAGGYDEIISECIMPVATKALGGLMMFDGKLTEDVTNVGFPSDVSLKGWANRGVNTSNTLMGSLNTSESGKTSDGYKSVWDFGTSQANGTIASLALCNSLVSSPLSGIITNLDSHSLINTSGNSWYSSGVFHFDGEYAYSVMGSGNTQSEYHSATKDTPSYYTYTITINLEVWKERVPLTKYKVADAMNQRNYPEQLTTATATLENVRYTLVNEDYPSMVVTDGNNSKAYLLFTAGNSQGNAHVDYIEIDYSKLDNIKISGMKSLELGETYLKRGNGIASGGKFYFISYDRKGIYTVEIANTANVQYFALPEPYLMLDYERRQMFVMTGNPNGGVFFGCYKDAENGASGYYDYYRGFLNSQGAYSIDGAYYGRDTNIARITNTCKYRSKDFLNAWWYGYGYGLSEWSFEGKLLGNYLGTICNLGTPVVKNASQTLKVTYTLTDGE